MLQIATRKQSIPSPDEDWQYCSRNVAINKKSDSIVRQTSSSLFPAFLYCMVHIISFLLDKYVTRNEKYQKPTNLHQFRFVQEDKRVCWPKPQTKHPIVILVHPP